jgi:STE24 endopeptidase
MPSEGLARSETPLGLPGRAKAYNRTKLIAGLSSSVISFLLLVLLVWLDATRPMAEWAWAIGTYQYFALLVFTALVAFLQTVITFPVSFYSSYIVEHRYNLSNQSLGQWAWERLKESMVGLPLVAGIVMAVYFCMETYGNSWWLPVSVLLSLVSVLLARIAPVLFMPLFYKFEPLPDGSLKDRIIRLCAAAGLKFEGIFTFNLSKNTKKANAGFTGIGKSRRIILGDTLVREFSEEEIETVFAHELGHYKYRHILVGIVTGILSTFVGLYLASRTYAWSIKAFGFDAITDLGALPLLAIWLSLFGVVTAPIGNILSRRHERQADAYAVRVTKNGAAFAAALRRLASTNLADPEPHPLVEFLFYRHPSISKRIRLLESAAP